MSLEKHRRIPQVISISQIHKIVLYTNDELVQVESVDIIHEPLGSRELSRSRSEGHHIACHSACHWAYPEGRLVVLYIALYIAFRIACNIACRRTCQLAYYGPCRRCLLRGPCLFAHASQGPLRRNADHAMATSDTTEWTTLTQIACTIER